MPSTRPRTCATRTGVVRPGSSIVTGTLVLCTVTTETSGTGATGEEAASAPHPATQAMARSEATHAAPLGPVRMRPIIAGNMDSSLLGCPTGSFSAARREFVSDAGLAVSGETDAADTALRFARNTIARKRNEAETREVRNALTSIRRTLAKERS